MGHWDIYPFDNDMACDFWAGLRETPIEQQPSKIVGAFENMQAVDYLDDDDVTPTQVCAVVVLAIADPAWFAQYTHINDYFRKQVNEFVANFPKVWEGNDQPKYKDGKTVFEWALAAMDLATSPESETYELYEGSEQWLASCDELKTQLRKFV